MIRDFYKDHKNNIKNTNQVILKNNESQSKF